MALFSVNVQVRLQLSEYEKDRLERIAVAADRTAAALEALVAKINEDDSPQAVTLDVTAGTPVEQKTL